MGRSKWRKLRKLLSEGGLDREIASRRALSQPGIFFTPPTGLPADGVMEFVARRCRLAGEQDVTVQKTLGYCLAESASAWARRALAVSRVDLGLGSTCIDWARFLGGGWPPVWLLSE